MAGYTNDTVSGVLNESLNESLPIITVTNAFYRRGSEGRSLS